MPLVVTPRLVIPDAEISLEALRAASGPGGQNVNKTATAIRLRFDAAGSPSLDERVRDRALSLAGARATSGGEIVITANRFASQERNRQDALARLADLLARAAAPPPKKRIKTKPSRAAKARRMDAKTHRGAIKAGRQSKPGDD
jgi:ribosome-associated protein